MAGKGSKPRPIEIDRKQFESNWDRIFSKKIVEETWAHNCKHNGSIKISKGQQCSWCGEEEPE